MDAKAAILSSMRTWTIRNRFGKARTKPVPAIVPIAPSRPTLAVEIASPSLEIAIKETMPPCRK